MTIAGVFKMLWNKIAGKDESDAVIAAEHRIERWRSIYKGTPDWLEYTYATLNGRIEKRIRKTMKPAKMVCAELSSLIWTEKPKINTSKAVEEVLSENAFFKNITRETEHMAALGAMILKLYIKDEKIKIDYLQADSFIPVSWDSSGIYDADILDRRVVDKKQYVRIESHRKNQDGTYTITHKAFEQVGGELVPTSLSVFGIDVPVQESPVKLFAYIGNPEANNIDRDSPLSISVFANATDTLESLDIAFDALRSEIVLGRKRIIVPAGAVRTIVDPETGKPKRYYDPSDEVFQAFNVEDKENLKITDNTVELRIDEIRLAIQTLLDILCVQIGFNPGYLSFDGSSMKTATEVISENSKTFKTKQYIENAIGYGIIELLAGIHGLLGETSEGDSIEWDDSVIEDRNAKAAYLHNRLSNRTIERWRVISYLDGVDEAEARKRADEIATETATVDASTLFGGIE